MSTLKINDLDELIESTGADSYQELQEMGYDVRDYLKNRRRKLQAERARNETLLKGLRKSKEKTRQPVIYVEDEFGDDVPF